MKPDFEQYRGARNTPKESIAFRMPAAMRVELERIALVERDTLSGLALEGVMRVILDRRSDPDYDTAVHAALQTQVADLEDQLAAARIQMEERNPPDLPG